MPDLSAKVESLSIAGDIELWRSIGLTALDDGTIPLFGTSLRVVPPPGTGYETDKETDRGTERGTERGADKGTGQGFDGIVGWELSGVDEPASPANSYAIDGLPTQVVAARDPVFASHDLGASALDHVVVLTPDLERTSNAIAGATGCELKRIREVGSMRQGFHRIGRGGLIVELVERPDIADGDAAFWGLVLIVDDIANACARLGPDRISTPKNAVQDGRQIATFRGDVGLGLPVAIMTG
jgi:hypothetical protein